MIGPQEGIQKTPEGSILSLINDGGKVSDFFFQYTFIDFLNVYGNIIDDGYCWLVS